MPCPGGECVMGENGESTCVCRVGQFFDESAAACTGVFNVCIMCAYLYIGCMMCTLMYSDFAQIHCYSTIYTATI